MEVAIGVDIGGTKIAAGVVTRAGEVRHRTDRATPASAGAAAVLATATELAVQVRAWSARAGLTIAGCGVGTAGTVTPHGVVTHATNSLSGWAGTDVAASFSSTLDLPVRVVNDVHALALAEHRFGAAAGHPSVLVVAVGTGIGGALIQAGRLVRGRTGSAGTIGHLPAPRSDLRRCPCGRIGHLEAYASGPAMVASYAEQGGTASRLEEVADRARAGEELARLVIEQAAGTLGRVVGGVANLLDPDVIVVGGGAAALGPLLLAPLERAARAEALAGPDSVRLTPAALGPLGALVGAASTAWEPPPWDTTRETSC